MKIRSHLALIPMLCMALGQKVHADEYYFGNAEQEAKMQEGSEPDMLRGVLLKRSRHGLLIRVVGGEISIPHSMVYKIISDDLTIADIERHEAEIADTLAEANGLRVQFQADEAAERLERTLEARQREALLDTERAEASAHQQHGSDYGIGYDPIIHRSVSPMLQHVVTNYIQSEYGGYIRRHVQRAIRRHRR